MIVYTLRQVAHWMSRVSIQKMRNTTRLHLSRFNHISATAAERLRGCTWAAQQRPSDVKKKIILPWNFALPRLHATASGCMKALSLFKSTQFRVGKHVQPIEDAKKRSPPLFCLFGAILCHLGKSHIIRFDSCFLSVRPLSTSKPAGSKRVATIIGSYICSEKKKKKNPYPEITREIHPISHQPWEFVKIYRLVIAKGSPNGGIMLVPGDWVRFLFKSHVLFFFLFFFSFFSRSASRVKNKHFKILKDARARKSTFCKETQPHPQSLIGRWPSCERPIANRL